MRKISCILVALALLLSAGCEPEGSSSSSRTPKPKPPAGAGAVPPKPKDNGGEGAQPAPVQGDPSAHNTQPGEVDLQVDWSGENKHTPSCLWEKNGVQHPCANMKDAAQSEGRGIYLGLWDHEERGAAGDRFYLAAQGWPGTDTITCSIVWKGKYHEGITKGTRCSVELVLP